MRLRSNGFSLVEIMVSLFTLSALGLGAMYVGQQQSKWQSGVSGSSELSRSFDLWKNVFTDPKACEYNFKDKQVGDTLDKLYNSDGEVKIKTGDNFANKMYVLTGIKIGEHDASASRTQVIFSYRKTANSARATSLTKSFSLFSRVSSGKIVDCLDPSKLSAESTVLKSCLDMDPLVQGMCEKNFENILKDIKEIYCKNHPFLEFDSLTQKCKPLDSGKSCGTQFLQGYDENGGIRCYAGPGSTPNCNNWSAWSPSEMTICLGKPFQQTRTCMDTGSESIKDTQIQTGKSMIGGCEVFPICGTSHGQSLNSAPTDNLCSVGTASSVSGSGPWNWTCSAIGSGSGSLTSCSASKRGGSCSELKGGKIINDSYYLFNIACFTAGTLVTMDSGELKNIEDVQVGEMVLTYNEWTGKFTSSPVEKTFHHKKSLTELYTFTFMDGQDLTSTHNHLIFSKRVRNYLSAKKIYELWVSGIDPELVNDRFEVRKIIDIKRKLRSEKLYNLHVTGEYDRSSWKQAKLVGHNFLANGILVHNEKASADCFGDEKAACDCCNNNGGEAIPNPGYPRGIKCEAPCENVPKINACMDGKEGTWKPVFLGYWWDELGGDPENGPYKSPAEASPAGCWVLIPLANSDLNFCTNLGNPCAVGSKKIGGIDVSLGGTCIKTIRSAFQRVVRCECQ